MSAVESSQSDSRTSPAQKRRVSIANWFFAATITGLWTLVAGPGVVTETMATSRAGSRIYESGWPAVHCVFLETSMDPGMIGSPGQKMLEKFVDGARSEFLKKKFGFKWAEAGHQNHKSQVGLWSNSSNWQYFRNDPKKILWSGLAVNLLILLLMVATVVVFVEYRIRSRGLLFRFSMAELLVLFTCFGLGLWQIGMMLSASARDHLAASQIQRFDQTHLDWRNNLPIVLLRLLDNRSSFVIPWTDKVLTVDRVDRVSVTNVGHVIPSESAKKAFLESVHTFGAAKSLNVVTEPAHLWLFSAADFDNFESLEVFISYCHDEKPNFDWSWIQKFPNLESISFDYECHSELWPEIEQEGSAEVVLSQIKHPNKLSHLSIGSGVPIDETTDLRRFSNLKSLELPELPPETREALIRNNQQIQSLLKQ